MEISKKQLDGTVTVSVTGRIDSSNCGDFEAAVMDALKDAECLVLDMSQTDYFSSAALRVILLARKKLGSSEKLHMRGANETIKEILTVTGFDSVLTMDD